MSEDCTEYRKPNNCVGKVGGRCSCEPYTVAPHFAFRVGVALDVGSFSGANAGAANMICDQCGVNPCTSVPPYLEPAYFLHHLIRVVVHVMIVINSCIKSMCLGLSLNSPLINDNYLFKTTRDYISNFSQNDQDGCNHCGKYSTGIYIAHHLCTI